MDGKSLKRSGERGRNRTYNLLIKSQLLCQLSYAPTVGNLPSGQILIVAFPISVVIARAATFRGAGKN